MSGPKTNERPVARPNGTRAEFTDRVGTRAVLRHARMSPFKVREVLDLVRGRDIASATDILRFCERDAAIVVGKLLASAVANAEHNDNIPAEELYVSACFADGGPTLKRWRPRARGRATRIQKKTSHITIIVNRLPEGELEVRQSQAAESRARRTAGQRRRDRRNEAAAAAAEEASLEATATGEEAEASENVSESADAPAEVTEATTSGDVADEATVDASEDSSDDSEERA